MNALQKAKEDYEQAMDELKSLRTSMKTALDVLSGAVYAEADLCGPWLLDLQLDFGKLSRLKEVEHQAMLKFRELEKVYNEGVEAGKAAQKERADEAKEEEEATQ